MFDEKKIEVNFFTIFMHTKLIFLNQILSNELMKVFNENKI